MKEQFEKLLDRIDALSLRERIFLSISVLACLLGLLDLLWLSPVQSAHRALTQRFGTQNTELTRLRDELRLASVPVDPSKIVKEDLATAVRRLEALNAEINTLLPMAQGGQGLEAVLVQLLRKQDGLTLLGLSTLKPEAAGAGAGASLDGLTKRGLELRLSGAYPELVRYLQTLETGLPSLRWGAMELKSEKQATELSLQVYAVGVQP
jgi:MSHA biogenesis protein MshJ